MTLRTHHRRRPRYSRQTPVVPSNAAPNHCTQERERETRMGWINTPRVNEISRIVLCTSSDSRDLRYSLGGKRKALTESLYTFRQNWMRWWYCSWGSTVPYVSRVSYVIPYKSATKKVSFKVPSHTPTSTPTHTLDLTQPFSWSMAAFTTPSRIAYKDNIVQLSMQEQQQNRNWGAIVEQNNTFATMYSASSGESKCNFLQMSRKDMREYDKQIIRTPVLITLCRRLCNGIAGKRSQVKL